jgi:hypothetical protein
MVLVAAALETLENGTEIGIGNAAENALVEVPEMCSANSAAGADNAGHGETL